MWRRLSYALAYRTGRTPWDTGVTPPELVDLIQGADALTSGSALDMGCGTGTNVAYLADRGWTATGVEADRRAVETAERRVLTSPGATLFVFAFARRPGLVPIGVTPREMRDRFAPWFAPVGRIAGTQPPGAAW